MNKITKLVGAMSIGALAMVGCKSSEPAPADNQGSGASTEPARTDGSSCGAASQPAEGDAKPADGGSCGGGH